MNEIGSNIAAIRERISAAAADSGRSPDEITLVAVTKRVDPARILQAHLAGIGDFGENYYQEAREKLNLFGPEVRWHFIGRLQTNKAKYVAGRFETVQSVDSIELANSIAKRAEANGIRQKCLIEVKLDPDETKAGIPPEETQALALRIAQLENIDLVGLMGMPPFEATGELARPYFARLRRLFETLPAENRHILSMGMSADFEAAIQEGSTMIRIGTGIFGKRSS